MANLKTLTIDGVSTDNYHPGTLTASSKTYSLASGSVKLWDTGVKLPSGFCFIGGTLTFPTNSTGSRFFQFGSNNGSVFSDLSSMRVPATPSGDTILFGYGTVVTDGTQTLACKIFQNSGSTQTVELKYSIRNFPTLLG